MNTLFLNFSYFIVIYLVSYSLSKINILGRIFGVIVPIVILFQILINNPSFSGFSPFGIIKGISVLVPVMLYSNYKYFKNTKLFGKSVLFWLTIILFFNILQPAFILELPSHEILSKFNGLLIVILALYTPQLVYDNKLNIVNFNNHFLWGIAYTIILTCTYLFNNYFKHMNWRYSGIYSIIIPTLHSVLTGSTRLWFPLRVYSLTLTFLILFVFNKYDKYVTEKLTKSYLWSTDKYDNIKLLGSILGLSSIILIVFYYNIKNTIIGLIDV